MKIGIFDSGIGGLTVLNELIKSYPFAHYIYYGDTKNLPYGNKDKEKLLKFTNDAINFLKEKGAEIIVIACGTVSSNVYNDINKDIPIYDVISPVIDYIKENKLKNVGALATSMTIKSKIFEKENIIAVPCPNFVPLIEKGKKVDKYAKAYLQKLNNCENIVLGCTHFPLIENTLKKYKNVNYINMGKCLVNKIKISKKDNLKIELYFSKVDKTLEENVKKILGENYAGITRS